MSSVDGGSAAPPTAGVPKSWHARQCSGGCGRELAARTADPAANVFCDVCHPGRLPLEPIETRHLDTLWQPRRKPAYDAVYAYIGGLGEALPTEPVRRNAMIWRAVNGALDALDHSGVAGEPEATAKEASEIAVAVSPTPTHAPTPETPGAVNVAGGRPYLNPGTDPVSQRTYALIFNGLSRGLADVDRFVALSERRRVSEAIYEELRNGGVEVRLEDGLERLRAVAGPSVAGGVTVPDEAVRAFNAAWWDASNVGGQDETRIGLTAAAPLIAAQALRDARYRYSAMWTGGDDPDLGDLLLDWADELERGGDQ